MYPVQALFAVPKRRFPRAVHRNLLKRRIREAYRQQKSGLYTHLEDRPFTMTLAIQYTANEVLDHTVLFARLAEVLQRLQHESDQIHMGKSR